jgi:hypothetical protein
MNTIELRDQITQWLNQLSPEHLVLVANFVDFLNQKQQQGVVIAQSHLTLEIQSGMLAPVPMVNSGMSSSKLGDLLEFAGSWEGDDLRECLELVHQQRAPLEL